MKTMFMKLLSLVLSFVLFATIVEADTTKVTAGDDCISAIYDYTNFANAGMYTKIKDLVNDKETRVYANMRIQGYYGTDKTFIKETMTTLNGNGVTTRVDDLINQTHRVYNETGQVTKAWMDNPTGGEAYEATIKYESDGDYTISWTGSFDDTNDGKDDGKTGIKSVEYYTASGKILKSANYTWDSDKNKSVVDGETVYTYNKAGTDLLNVTTYAKKDSSKAYSDSNRQKASITYYEAGRADRVVTYNYSDNNKATHYVSAKYSYNGSKMASVTNFTLEDGEEKLYTTTKYDNHGRQYKTLDSTNRVINKITYNDTSTKEKIDIYDYKGKKVGSVTVNAGGISKSEQFTYDGNSKTVAKIVTTYYRNGNSNTPWGDVDTYINNDDDESNNSCSKTCNK